jgi:chloramphenicol O-acetyltransferase type A
VQYAYDSEVYMKEIDMNTWKRKEHFNFFTTTAYPIYNITFNLDVTKVRSYTKKNNISFNLAMIYLSTKALNSIENFRYRLRDNRVILHDLLTPSYAEIDKGSDLFKMITVPMEPDILQFIKHAEDRNKEQKTYFNINDFVGHDDLVFYSTLPWISFTSIDHTINMKREDAIERISFGKYFMDKKKVLMPYNIQVNHLFVDGIHLGIFKYKLDELIENLR